jgi:hypothetical protein
MTRKSKRQRRPNPHYLVDEATGDVTINPRAKLLTRQAPTMGPFNALERVHEELAVATELYENHGDGGKAGAFKAVIAVIEYFASRGIPRATLSPLTAIIVAMVDADQGVQSPIFKPFRKGGGAPPSSNEQLSFEGLLAVVTECCVRHCKAEGKRPYIEPGARMAESMIRKSRWGIDPGFIRLREIRERISTADKDSPDRSNFDLFMSSTFAETTPLDYAKAMLNSELVVGIPDRELSGEPANTPEED